MTDEQRDNILLSISTKIDNLDGKVNKLDSKVNELDGKVNKLDDKVNNLEGVVVKLSEEVKKNTAQIEKNTAQIKENTTELERQRENIARLEFTFNDKIKALFDAREANFDKFEDYEKNFKSINKILDYHNARLFKLETSRN